MAFDRASEKLPPIKDNVVFVDTHQTCWGSGVSCYNKANRSWDECSRCRYEPEQGVISKGKLCPACIHEGFPERKENKPDTEKPCRCHVNLWWWDHEHAPRMKFLQQSNPGFLGKVSPPPEKVDPSGRPLVPPATGGHARAQWSTRRMCPVHDAGRSIFRRFE